MGYFPFFMEIEGKHGVVVGGGKVAARKVEKLLLFGPVLTVIAPVIDKSVRRQGELLQKDAAPSLLFRERAVLMEDLSGADFVIAATDDAVQNGRIAAYCRTAGIPVNVVDDREKCTFFFPALIKDGSLTIGISTDGKSPAAASWTRQKIAEILPEGLGTVIDLMGQIRPAVMQMEADEAARKKLLTKLFLYGMEKEQDISEEEMMNFLQAALQKGHE